MVDVHLSSFACARGTNSNELCRRSRWDHVGEQTLNLLAGRSSSSRVASSDILGRNWTGSWGKYSGGGSDSDRHQTFSCSNSARLFPRLLRIVTLQPSIAPDTLANHALWSFDEAQSSVFPTFNSGRLKTRKVCGSHRRRRFGSEHPVFWRQRLRDISTPTQK
jgi:hypothetical protein